MFGIHHLWQTHWNASGWNIHYVAWGVESSTSVSSRTFITPIMCITHIWSGIQSQPDRRTGSSLAIEMLSVCCHGSNHAIIHGYHQIDWHRSIFSGGQCWSQPDVPTLKWKRLPSDDHSPDVTWSFRWAPQHSSNACDELCWTAARISKVWSESLVAITSAICRIW